MSKQVLRKYHVPDAIMIEDAKTRRNSFIEDQADFVNEDVSFSNPYEVTWLNAIDNSEAQETDETVRDQTQQLTQLVEGRMADCRKKYNDTKFFIEKAFPDSPINRNIWKEFGYDDYPKARDTQSRMV